MGHEQSNQSFAEWRQRKQIVVGISEGNDQIRSEQSGENSSRENDVEQSGVGILERRSVEIKNHIKKSKAELKNSSGVESSGVEEMWYNGDGGREMG